MLNSEKKFALCATKKINILTLVLSEKKILNQTKFHNPPFKLNGRSLTTKSSKLQWFQYRIIHRILGTNSLLYKINQKPNDKCSFCLKEVETIEHIF